MNTLSTGCSHAFPEHCGCPKAPPSPSRASAAIVEQVLQQVTQGRVEDPEATLRQLQALACRAKLSQFVKEAWHVIEGDVPLTWNWHHELICSVLQGMFEDWLKTKSDPHYQNPIRNVVIGVPPGSLKSRLIAVFFPVWAWLRRPGWKLICLSVNDKASLRDGRASRQLIRSKWFRDMFQPEWDIRDDQDSISSYGNTMGGERLSQAMGSELVGLRADCLAGESLVSTEEGDVAIAKLHERALRGERLPRVWAMNHGTGEPELREVIATRRIPNREVVDIRTQSDNVLRCTDDHRVHSGDQYVRAADLSNRPVSVMRRPVQAGPDAPAPALREIPPRRADVRDVHEEVHAPGRGVRQARGARRDCWALLLEALQDDRLEPAGDLEGLRALWNDLPTALDEGHAQVLLDHLQGRRGARAQPHARQEVVPALPDGVPPADDQDDLLLEAVREPRARASDDGPRELELHWAPEEDLRWVALGQPAGADQGEGRRPVRVVRDDGEWARVPRSPRRPRPDAQRAGEPDHALRPLPHAAPQVEEAAAASVNVVAAGGRRAKVDVYDLCVEGLHNFFAQGILVHNCLIVDDANNPFEAENDKEREKINETWRTNAFNRVNDMRTSLRIGVQQRVHEKDWTGFVTSTDGTWAPEKKVVNGRTVAGPSGWLVVALPSEYEAKRRCVTPWGSDPRTVEGETIDPVRFPMSVLEDEKKRLRDKYDGQHQQRPSSGEGGAIKKAWFSFFRLAKGVNALVDDGSSGRARPDGMGKAGERVRLIPQRAFSPDEWEFDSIDVTIDCANKATVRGSNYGILACGVQGQRVFVLEDVTQKGEFHEIVDVVCKLISRWRARRVLIEDKAAGPTLITTLQNAINDGSVRDDTGRPIMCIVERIPANGAFEERVDAMAFKVRQGLVHLLDGASWLEDFVSEFTKYPRGENDDRLDCLAQLLAHLGEETIELPDW